MSEDKHDWRNPANWLMATVTDDRGGVLLTAIMTPPHRITFYATDNKYNEKLLECLIDGILGTGFIIPGIVNANPLALNFAEIFCAKKGINYLISKNLRLYELTEVNSDISMLGVLRPAKESDMAFVPYWEDSFCHDCSMASAANTMQSEEYYRHSIGNKPIFWRQTALP